MSDTYHWNLVIQRCDGAEEKRVRRVDSRHSRGPVLHEVDTPYKHYLWGCILENTLGNVVCFDLALAVVSHS